MRRFVFTLSLLCAPTVSFAQGSAPKDPKVEEHIQMHEKVGEAHQKVAACLRSGKSMDECGGVFHTECDAIPQSKGFCGRPHGKGKGKHHHGK